MERLTEQERNSDGTGISKQSLIDRPGKGYVKVIGLDFPSTYMMLVNEKQL